MKKIKYVAQIQQAECGLSVIVMLLNYYGAYCSLYDIRKIVQIGRDGMTLVEVMNVLNNFDIDTKVGKCSNLTVLKKIKTPFIITLSKRHLVIVEKVMDTKICIIDPAIGRVKYSYSELQNVFDGICVELSPRKNFKKKKREFRILKDFFPLIVQKKKQYITFLFISLINYFIMILLPVNIKRLIDVKYDNTSIVHILLCVFLICILYVMSNLIVKFYLTNLKVNIDKQANIKVISHLMRLPYLYFDTRKKADIIYTLNHVSSVREVLVTNFLGIILCVGIILAIELYFFVSNAIIAIILNLAVLPNIVAAIISQCILTNNMRRVVMENSIIQGYQTEMIHDMFAIKTECIENRVLDDWLSKYNSYNEKYSYNEKLSSMWNTILSMCQMLSPILVLIIGILLSKMSVITIGEVIAYFSLSEIFFSQVYGLFDSVLNMRINYLYVERLGDILYVDTENSGKNCTQEIEAIQNIKIKSMWFRYTANTKYVLNDIDFNLKKGNIIAIVGKSGSGKSTFLKVLSGLYEQTSGDIYINDKSNKDIVKKSIAKQIGIVFQDSCLFNKTIYDNLVINVDDTDCTRVEEILKKVDIYDDIMKMPMGLNTLVSEMGMNLSGGQRQRIIIARELLKNPSLLLLDEATSALDYTNEKRIFKYIKELNITSVIVTHRLTSIQNVDKILYMQNGRIVEAGTHDELIEQQGLYYKMFSEE